MTSRPYGCSAALLSSTTGSIVLEARDGIEALELARLEKPDLILLDLMMPGQDGWHVAKALSDDEATNRIPIVFLSAFAQPADRARGLESGAIGYYHEAVQPAAAASDGARVPWASRRSTSENTRRWRGARHVSAPDELDPRRLAVVAARLTAFHSCTLTIRSCRVLRPSTSPLQGEGAPPQTCRR